MEPEEITNLKKLFKVYGYSQKTVDEIAKWYQ